MKLFLLFIASFSIGIFAKDVEVSRTGRRMMPWYVVIRIPNQVCESTFSGNSGGVCVTRKDCRRINGTESGECAQGYGVCCSVTLDCSSTPETVRVNGTHLVNPTPLTDLRNCRWRFPRPPGVCQIRLDFLNYNTQLGDQPFLGDCETDTLNIVGASNTRNLGALCGNLTGQHMYLDYGTGDLISLLNFIDTAMGQTWDIQVTYIKCDSPEKAPDGCLQYYTDLTGRVESFNFRGMQEQQLNNEDYTVCIKSQPGMASITWDDCGGFTDFFITGQAPIPGIPGFPPIVNPMTGSGCDTDWVMIFGTDKYCGNAFAGPVTSNSQPFVLQVHFNEWEIAPPGVGVGFDASNRGFCMMYRLSP